MAKKKRGAEAPLFVPQRMKQLVVQRFSPVITRAGTIRQDQRQIAHCEIACADIADERKAVSQLELADCDHVPLESGCCCRCQGHISSSGRYVASIHCRRGGRTIEVQGTRTGLSACAKRICRGVRDRQTGVEAGLVGHEREEQNRVAEDDRQDIR